MNKDLKSKLENLGYMIPEYDYGFTVLTDSLMGVKEYEEGICHAFFPLKKHQNVGGSVHGGIQSLFCDHAMGWSLYHHLGLEHPGFVTVELQMKYLKRAMCEEVIEGHTDILKVTRSLAFLECRLVQNDDLITKATALFKLQNS